MNIFYLDTDPRQSAIYHCDSHMRKMIVVYAQMLCVGHWMSRDEDDVQRAIENEFYRPTHVNQPSTKWTSASAYTYAYVFTMWEELLLMYHERYHKEHGAVRFRDALQHLPKALQSDITGFFGDIGDLHEGMLPPPMCFKNEFAHLKKDVNVDSHEQVVEAYRSYYREAKHKFATWGGGRDLPRWWLKVA